jgi:hypothetical protein
MSQIVRVLTRDCQEKRLPVLQKLSESLHECVGLNEDERIDRGVAWGNGAGCLPTQKQALGFLSTALGIGLDANEDSDSNLSRMCSKIQSRAFRLMHDMGRRTVGAKLWVVSM